MFKNKIFKNKDEQASQIWQYYRDIAIFIHDESIDYPLKINKMLELIEYAERELLEEVNSFSNWDCSSRPSPKDYCLARFYYTLSKFYQRNNSLTKAEEMLQRALALNDSIEKD